MNREQAIKLAEAVRLACHSEAVIECSRDMIINLNIATIVDAHVAQAQAGLATTAADDLQRVYDEFGIGAKARTIGILLANVSNALRRSECLSAIEREFFMVPGEVDEDYPDQEPEEECLLNWGHTPDQYVEAFREALQTITARQPAPVNQQMLAALKAVNDKFKSRPYGTGSYITKDVRDMVANTIAAAEAIQPVGDVSVWQQAFRLTDQQAIRYVMAGIVASRADRITVDHGGPVYDAAGSIMESFEPEAVVVSGTGQRYCASNVLNALVGAFHAEHVPDEETGEPFEESLLNWGEEPDDYIKRFREALKSRAAVAVPDGWRDMLEKAVGLAHCVGASEAALTTTDIEDAQAFIERVEALLAAAPKPEGES